METRLTLSVLAVLLPSVLPPAHAQTEDYTSRPSSREGLVGVDTFQGWVITGAGHRLRAIITRPHGVEGRLPAILFVQWLSCDTIELPREGGGGWTEMLRGMIQRSGMVFMRTEKVGVGESEGADCSDLDYDTELRGHAAALQVLQQSEHVDPNNIFVFGASMGGNMAPLLAQGKPIRGILIWGTTGLTWAEHMIRLDRRVLEFQEHSPQEVNEYIDDHIAFHTMYLIEQRSPADIITEQPRLADAWNRMLGTEPAHQYGRSIAFHHQAHEANWEAAWGEIDVPVLVVHGEYDWIMAKEEHERIVQIVNRNRPGTARLVTYPKMDHHFETYSSPRDAFDGNGGPFGEGILDVFLDWLNDPRQDD